MIRCHWSYLAARCIQRGYSPDEVAGCVVWRDGDEIVVDETHPAYPRPRPGLGDLAAVALAAVGITKDRFEAIVGGPCGCDERQAWMNAAGEKWLGLPPGSTAPPPVDPEN